jgi:hypothetical protein
MDFTSVRHAALVALAPIAPASAHTKAVKDFLFSAKRSAAGRDLPAYYLVYFLLVDLLGFKNLGQFEKGAWSVPIDFNGQGFLIEYRKFGLGVFMEDAPGNEEKAAEIVELICRGAKEAEPYFDWRAQQAVAQSKLNVLNKAGELFERYRFFADRYEEVRSEAETRANERITTEIRPGAWTTSFPSFALRRQAKWLALSTIDCFFSWTEHVFILLAILQGYCSTGDGIAKLAAANWSTKFKAALDLCDAGTKNFYDELLAIRHQFRNFVAHGAFGKEGEAFQFHSNCGTVPVILPHRQNSNAYRFGRGIEFVDHEAIKLLHAFVQHLWSATRAPAKLYIQEYSLPVILTFVQNGDYQRALASEKEMEEFANYLVAQMDRHANMDF